MSPIAVTCLNVGDAVVPVPYVLLTDTTLTRLNRLNASTMASIRWPRNAMGRDTRRSKDEVPQFSAAFAKHDNRCEFRPTPSGRSFTVVSLFRSLPVTTLKGAALAYENTYPS